jgi:hypothetical protein
MPEQMNSVEVRSKLIDALHLDLVGPSDGLGDANEVLPQSPSRWYLTGFLVPLDAVPEDKSDQTADDDLDVAGEAGGVDDDDQPERPAARVRYFPSSIGVSILVPASAKTLKVRASWGDYHLRKESPEEWERTAREESVVIELAKTSEKPLEKEVPNSSGLKVAYLARPVGLLAADSGVPVDARTVSVFLVNRRTPQPDAKKDEGFAFQVQLEIGGDTEFLPRPDLRSMASGEWDERVADLQYRDVGEYSVGHNIATDAMMQGGKCCEVVRTSWIPQGQVERVEPAKMDIDLSMDNLAVLKDSADASAKLSPLVTAYKKWIDEQAAGVPASPAKRKETGEELLDRARYAAKRIQAGIDLLADPECLDAFRIANKCMADAARQRQGVMVQKNPAEVNPTWRPFQLAFILMNLKAIAEPNDNDRQTVDLLFFPTGGGKTEAYLGLAAFTLLLRRFRNPGIQSAGLSVLMRYTLRLLTLDQLGRAATLICALELVRKNDVEKFGEWPFEIGLWVGRAATPNQMGSKGDNNPNTARARTRKFWDSDKNPSPIPLEECPWCGTKFSQNSFRLKPNQDNPTDLLVKCVKPGCAFAGNSALPIVAVDEQLYRRLPCFMIATVDKFAALPWTGQVGAFFGKVDRSDNLGFYGPCDPTYGSKLPGGRLLPPDLIIQDELHLISGPLGTMVGLYESALDELCTMEKDGKRIRTKIIASTATVRRADSQIRALFNRQTVDIFPPPGPDRRDSFFAKTLAPSEANARLYVGVAAQGRSPKVAMLRVYLALLGSGQRWHNQLKKRGEKSNASDPYMTLVGYFNSLRELGGARRIIEDEVRNRLAGYSSRKRIGETQGLFDDRKVGYEPVELTSRVSTDKVSLAKRRLALLFSDESHVDVAIATNMISVGLDIIRLGLMVVFGQPKASAEYIQATSRVGRDVERPGLVVTIFNVHKPRDRSHFERFSYYHQTFYRSVEATSVTPFSPRALDKGLAATLVGLSRHGYPPMTPPRGAMEILTERARLEAVVQALADRAFTHSRDLPTEEKERLRLRVQERARDLLDDWAKAAQDYQNVGTGLQYNPVEAGGAKQLLYDFLSPDVKNLPPDRWQMKFRANRSLRDVEPEVNLWVRTLADEELEEEKI